MSAKYLPMMISMMFSLSLVIAGCSTLDGKPSQNVGADQAAQAADGTPPQVIVSTPAEVVAVPITLDAPTPVPTTASTSTAVQVKDDLDDLGPAPDLKNQVWLNTPGPLRLSDLRGKVVLLEMWTFG